MFVWVLMLSIVSSFLSAQIDRSNVDEGFDKPLRTTVVDLGPSPFYRASQHVRNKLTCYYYSSFAVKQYDEGQKGAEWFSTVSSPTAACTRRHEKDERVYLYPDAWKGYFRGAKGALMLFDAPDGQNGGLPFAVFDVETGRKLFEDSSLLDYQQKALHIKNAFRITSEPRLTYLRVVPAGCDLRAELADCWNKVRTDLGITQAAKPVCSGYEKADVIRESAVAYPVSVLLTATPEIKAVDGPIFCWPAD